MPYRRARTRTLAQAALLAPIIVATYLLLQYLAKAFVTAVYYLSMLSSSPGDVKGYLSYNYVESSAPTNPGPPRLSAGSLRVMHDTIVPIYREDEYASQLISGTQARLGKIPTNYINFGPSVVLERLILQLFLAAVS